MKIPYSHRWHKITINEPADIYYIYIYRWTTKESITKITNILVGRSKIHEGRTIFYCFNFPSDLGGRYKPWGENHDF